MCSRPTLTPSTRISAMPSNRILITNSRYLYLYINICDDGGIKIAVMHNPIHADQYLYFQSHYLLEHKRYAVRTLLSRSGNCVTTTSANAGKWTTSGVRFASMDMHNGPSTYRITDLVLYHKTLPLRFFNITGHFWLMYRICLKKYLALTSRTVPTPTTNHLIN